MGREFKKNGEQDGELACSVIIWTLSVNDRGGCFECLRQRPWPLLLMPNGQQVYWQGYPAPLWRQCAFLLLLTFKVLEDTLSSFER